MNITERVLVPEKYIEAVKIVCLFLDRTCGNTLNNVTLQETEYNNQRK
jgi:hypothetical protein